MGEWLDRYRQAVAQRRAEALPGKPEGPSVSEAPQPCPEEESNTFTGLLFPLETPLEGQHGVESVPLNHWIEFHSPALGRCTGLVVGVLDEASLVVDHHSVLKAPTPIRAEWVVRVLSEAPSPAPEATP